MCKPFHRPVDSAGWQFCSKPHLSRELIGVTARPSPATIGQVLLHTCECCSLVRVTITNPHWACPHTSFCVCQHMLWFSPVCRASYVALMHTHRCCNLAQCTPPCSQTQSTSVLFGAAVLTSLALMFTSRSCYPAGKCRQFPNQACSWLTSCACLECNGPADIIQIQSWHLCCDLT